MFGDAGRFFISQEFSLGGVQYGEPLRGYDGVLDHAERLSCPGAGSQPRRASSFGNAFFTTTAELGLRFNQQLYSTRSTTPATSGAGRDFDPTRLFRGAGVGVALVTPLGPLGLDWAYGFDRVDTIGRPAPKWQLHFRLGNLF